MKNNQTKGFSFTIVIGRYAGFNAQASTVSWRLCLGWVAFTVYPQTDIEGLIQSMRLVRKGE